MAQSHLAIMTLLAVLGSGACSHSDDQQAESGAISNRIEIAVTADGFVPSQSRVRVGQPVTLTVTRKVDRTCATDIVIKDYRVNEKLPLNQPVAVTFTPTAPGPIRYACAMNMVVGELVAE